MSSSDELNRRKFLERMGLAAALGAGLSASSLADSSPQPESYSFINSYGETTPVNPDVLAAGVMPPPGMFPTSNVPNNANLRPNDAPVNQPDQPNSQAAQPNILMIMVDQLRAPKWFPPGASSAIAAMTPAIASLQTNACVFPNYFPAATACTPSRATLQTGLYSQQECMFLGHSSDPPSPLPGTYADLQTAFPTIGTALRDQGYDTAWIGKWHLSATDSGVVSGQSCDLTGYGYNNLNNLPSTDKSKSPLIALGIPAGAPTPSPDGWVNEGAQNGIVGGSISMSPQIDGDSPEWYAADVDIFDWVKNNWKPKQPSVPWFLGVSFINPHDIAFFPYYFYSSLPSMFTPKIGSGAPDFQFPLPNPAGTGTPAGSGIIPTLPTAFTSNAIYVDPAGNPWNGTDQITAYNSAPTGFAGKPDLQTSFKGLLLAIAGGVKPQGSDTWSSAQTSNWQLGWESFLNHYLWMQICVDRQIAALLNLFSQADLANTIILFLSDHGEYGGSHTLNDKGAAAYDEAINVPLFIKYPGQKNTVTVPQMVSSVDVLPYLLDLSTGGNGWRTSGKYTYLSNRESITDFIYTASNPGISQYRRQVTVPDYQGNSVTLQYIFHTFDELAASETFIADTLFSKAQPPPQFRHVLALRTAVAVNASGVPTAGGKIVRYDTWVCNSTAPPGLNGNAPVASYHPQYEFYNYATRGLYPNGNSSELRNDVTLDSSGEPTGTSASYLAALNGAVAADLYFSALPASPISSTLATAQSNAQAAYLALSGTGTGGSGC